jgi:hypothetical protein
MALLAQVRVLQAGLIGQLDHLISEAKQTTEFGAVFEPTGARKTSLAFDLTLIRDFLVTKSYDLSGAIRDWSPSGDGRATRPDRMLDLD